MKYVLWKRWYREENPDGAVMRTAASSFFAPFWAFFYSRNLVHSNRCLAMTFRYLVMQALEIDIFHLI